MSGALSQGAVDDGGVLGELVAAEGTYNTCVESVQHLLQAACVC